MLATIEPIQPEYEALVLMIVGMGVVFVALLLLMLTVGVLNRLPGGDDPMPASAGSSTSDTKSATQAGENAGGTAGGVGGELVAVLSAAAATALQRPVRVTRVQQE